jgi:DNA repair photolyase
VICAPVLPGITDAPRQLEAVVKAAAEAKAVRIYANPLFLKPCSAAVFLPFLKEHFPKLVPDYEKRFKDRAFLPAAYRKRISGLMVTLRAKYGIGNDSRWKWENPVMEKEQQMTLF